MTKKRNYENDEEFKNFKLEDYLPSMNRREPKADTSASGQEPATEETVFFPLMDESDTSSIQDVVSKAIQTGERDVREEDVETDNANDDEADATSVETDTPAERAIVRRISSKQLRLSLDEYCTTYLQVPKISDRKPVFVQP